MPLAFRRIKDALSEAPVLMPGRTTTAIHISGTFLSQKNGEGVLSGSETDDYFHRERALDLTKHHQREVTSCLLTQYLNLSSKW